VREIRAAGFIVYRRRKGGIQYLTLRATKHGEWGPPKGHTDPGESDLKAAWRETEEESGLGSDDLVRNRWFEERIRYRLKKGRKTVAFFLAERTNGKIALSSEHDDANWDGLEPTLDLLPHEGVRDVLRSAAAFLKDPALRHGLDPRGACELLEEHCGANAKVVAHTAIVAEMARAIAKAWADVDSQVDANYVETCAWLHDIGRSVDHGPRHPLEGFLLLDELGHAGYAPTCLSHYTKGRSRKEMTGESDILDAMWSCCDLETFEPEERIVALADFLAVRDTKGTIKQRHADLVKRYGPSEFLDGSRAAAKRIRREFEERTGLHLYEVAGIPGY